MAMKWKLISIMLVLVMVGMAGIAATAAAQPTYMEKAKEVREKYKQAWQNYQEERQKYIQAHQKYKDLRNQIAFNHAKKFLNNGCHFAERWLERFRLYVSNSNIDESKKEELLSKIDSYIQLIEEKKAKINDSTTPEELREAARELRQEWNEIKQDIRLMVGEFAAYKLQVIIQKAEKVEVRLEEKIQELESQGVNTTELEAILDEYSQHVDSANESVQNALALYEQGDWKEASKELRKATQELNKAFKEIKLFVTKLRHTLQVSQGRIFFGNETGEVWAHGNGIVKLEGDAVVSVRGHGTLTVSPINAVVSVVGFGNATKDEVNTTVIYEGSGKAIVRGKNITVSITGENVSLFAKGKGSLYLNGTGFYRVKKLPEEEMTVHEYNESVTVYIGNV
ncbi:MAG: hypothetical protein H0Z28_11525 [Archaeoglobus sp.]|nr:hypothetical protein [Archaeoglobus sp.]